MQPIQTQWGISEAPEGRQFKSYQNARNKCSEVAIQKLIKKTKQTGASEGSRGWRVAVGVYGDEMWGRCSRSGEGSVHNGNIDLLH